MPNIAMDASCLPDAFLGVDQTFVNECSKEQLLAWDPDFTKVTPEEAARIKAAEESGFVAEKEIDWDNLGVRP